MESCTLLGVLTVVIMASSSQQGHTELSIRWLSPERTIRRRCYKKCIKMDGLVKGDSAGSMLYTVEVSVT